MPEPDPSLIREALRIDILDLAYPRVLSQAALRIRAEVSGFPPGKWERRLLMVLQVCFDDSGNAPEQELLVLGGLIATAERWIQFTQEWDTALKKAPKADFVKYTEISRGRGQFDPRNGWTDDLRLERLRELVAITTRHVMPVRFFRAVSHDHFNKYIRAVPFGSRTSLNDTPYNTMANHVTSHVVAYLAANGLGDPCDFYYDRCDVAAPFMQEMWPQVQVMPDDIPRELLPKGVRPAIGSLNFRDEGDFFPLQASDLIAGMTRAELLGEEILPEFGPLRALRRMGEIETEEMLRESGRRLRRHAQQFRFTHPGAAMYPFDPKTAKRTRKLHRTTVERVRSRRKKKSDAKEEPPSEG